MKTNSFFLAAGTVLALALTFLACEEKGKKAEQAETKETGETQNFKAVKIGSQTWMAENLNIQTGNSWCYGNDDANCKKYGRLYDWETAMKACPGGWHLPSREEWSKLVEAAGGDVAGKKLKSKSGWKDNDGKSGNGTDDYGFSALPGGNTGFDDGSFENIEESGAWWSATATECSRCGDAYTRHMHYNFDIAEEYDGTDDRIGFSVRCVKN